MIRIGVMGTSSIAERRMIPAIQKEASFKYAGCATSTREEMGFTGSEEAFAPVMEKKREKAARFQAAFGGTFYESYEALLADPDVDAVYIALPPALHFRWISAAIRYGKHVIAEKPFTTSARDTAELVAAARNRNISLIENYGFRYHTQMDIIQEMLESGAIGDLRLVRATFGFPHREKTDFRYNKALGGGALLDCGGYTIKAATAILGSDTEVTAAQSVIPEGYEVDLFGSVMMKNGKGICAQLSYGMDQYYRCELEIWGSRGLITAPRIFTAPDGFPAPISLKQGNIAEEKTACDDQFQRIVRQFEKSIRSNAVREQLMEEILLQGRLIEQVRGLSAI